jgi:hypothetical protein
MGARRSTKNHGAIHPAALSWSRGTASRETLRTRATARWRTPGPRPEWARARCQGTRRAYQGAAHSGPRRPVDRCSDSVRLDSALAPSRRIASASMPQPGNLRSARVTMSRCRAFVLSSSSTSTPRTCEACPGVCRSSTPPLQPWASTFMAGRPWKGQSLSPPGMDGLATRPCPIPRHDLAWSDQGSAAVSVPRSGGARRPTVVALPGLRGAAMRRVGRRGLGVGRGVMGRPRTRRSRR